LTSEEELQRAARAEQILGDELFKEAVQEVREALITGIERSAFTDEKTREKLAQQLVALTAIVTKLRGYVETGKLAEATIQQRTISERIRAVVNW